MVKQFMQIQATMSHLVKMEKTPVIFAVHIFTNKITAVALIIIFPFLPSSFFLALASGIGT
jgi:hypothetical protein